MAKLDIDMSAYKYRYKITSYRVIDGDTVELFLDLGMRRYAKESCRLAFINAPEGKNAEPAMWLRDRFMQYGLSIEAETHKADKYGRWIVELFYPVNGGWQSINREMVELELAVNY